MKISRFAVLGLSLLLVGCGTHLQERSRYRSEAQGAAVGVTGGVLVGSVANVGVPVGAAFGGIVGGAVGHYQHNQRIANLKQVLAKQGGQLVVLGDKVRIILPADALFAAQKPRLKYGVEPTLTAVANYLKQFPAVCITVAGYTDAMPNRAANLELSKLRAQQVASFLWSQGFNENCLRVAGYGQAAPIASNTTLRGRALNRRVEITLWQSVRQ